MGDDNEHYPFGWMLYLAEGDISKIVYGFLSSYEQ